MPRAPLTEEQKQVMRERLAKAREIKAAKFEESLKEPEGEADPVLPATSATVAAPVATVAPVAPVVPGREVTLVSVIDKNPLDICIRDVCWRGQEITIRMQDYRAVVRNNPDDAPDYNTIVEEVKRLLTEGGFKFVIKG